MPKSPSKAVRVKNARRGATTSVSAASFMMGTAGEPMGLDPSNARGANPYGAYSMAGAPLKDGDSWNSSLRPAGSQDVPGGGSTSEELVRRSNFWRDNYNPLRGLTIARLMALFEQAERGAFSEIQLTLRKAEKRFPVLKGFIEKLLSSIEELDGKVRVMEELPEGATPAMAEAQRAFLQGRYDLLRNFKTSVAQIALADVRGYAVLQKHRYQDGPNAGAVEELYWIEPWCWVRDGFYGDFYYNENSQFGVGLGSCQATLGEMNRIGSMDLAREDFVIRESESPLYEIALIAFVNWLMGRKDYAAFTEIFGIPNAIVIMPPNIAPGKEAEYQGSAEKVARGVSGALPSGSDVKFPTASVRGESPFEKFCEAQEKDVVLAGTGGHLTMLQPQHGGLGKGGAEEQENAWQKIAVTKAVRINDTLQRDFDAPELSAEFPGQPVCVYFAFGLRDEKDAGKVCASVAALAPAGVKPDIDWLNEATGYQFVVAPIPEPQDEMGTRITRPSDPSEEAVRNRLVKLLNRAGMDDDEKILSALQTELKPLTDRLEAVSKISDPDLRRQKLQAVQDDLDIITRDILADPSELTKVIAQLNAGALVEGMKNKPVHNRRILNMGQDQPRDSLGKWVDENGGGLSEKENIQRGQKAMDRAIRQKADVQKAMYRKGVGQIDFPHGSPGDKNQDYAGGHGVSHIIAKHGEETARNVPEVLGKGKISPHESANRRYVEHEGQQAILERKNSRSAFVITSFKPRK